MINRVLRAIANALRETCCHRPQVYIPYTIHYLAEDLLWERLLDIKLISHATI